MSDPLHVRVLRDGPRAWNAWRDANPGVVPLLDGLRISISERQFGPAQGGPIDLSLAELRQAELDHATLTDCNLTGAILTEADLSDARLDGADLQGADLSGANLAYASLGDARLDDTIICGIDLRLARGLTQPQIERALGDRRTVLPPGLERPGAWLPQEPPDGGQLVVHARGWAGLDESGDPYLVLGVSPGASIEKIRAAWLKRVKELHPDVTAGVTSAAERLKLVNQAYQMLKMLEREAGQHGSRASAGSRAWAVFATFFLLSAVIGLVAVAWIYFAFPDGDRDAAAPGGTVTDLDKSAGGAPSPAPPEATVAADAPDAPQAAPAPASATSVGEPATSQQPPAAAAAPVSAEAPTASEAPPPATAAAVSGDAPGVSQAPSPPAASAISADEPATGADRRLR
jgi:DnaJ-like protein/pentapeptide repeat protein